jgi:protein SMG8
MQDLVKKSDFVHFLSFHSDIRTRFARMLLLATQICHIVILVEPSSSLDTSYLSIFKALKIIREKYVLKFLPKLLKNTSIGSSLSREARLCSPRFIFFFEKAGRPIDSMGAYSIEIEDQIYQMLRTNFIITNNSQLSLFSIPKNQKFLFINDDETLNCDPVVDSLDLLLSYIENDNNEMMQYKPHRGFGINYIQDIHNKDVDKKKKQSFYNLLMDFVDEAFNHGFDDSISKYRGKNHFVWPSAKSWYEIFKLMHTIFIENPLNESFEARDADYKSFLDNFHKIVDIDQQLFTDSTNHGYELAKAHYTELLPHHYSSNYHESKVEECIEHFHRYARGPDIEKLENKLREECDSIWINGRQQCEKLSLRGNPCTMIAKHATNEGTMHSSGVIFVSACNCGRTQGRRDDPYTIRKANYEFYQVMRKSCTSCDKSEYIHFPIFVPSEGHTGKAAQVNRAIFSHLMTNDYSGKTPPIISTDHHLSASQKTQAEESDLSLGSSLEGETDDEENKKENETSEDEMEEIVVKIGELDVREEQTQASKTEYLPGMLLSTSPIGLLPEFPSWSLLCLANSSFYSHNTGLTESQMPGFLSGTNFLLPWDVKVRLEHAKTWAEKYEKNRSRKKHNRPSKKVDDSNYFTLKIFIGMEYECGRGHRFMMSSNDTILKGSTGGSKSSGCGSKIVFNDMPLVFPCPCMKAIAQLIRIHIVTPKAPVNLHIEPKIKIRRESEMIFVSGWNEPAKLSQSAYWVLRLPYAFIGEDEPISFPISDVPDSIEALRYGYLMAGMFNIKESESTEE